MRRSNWKKHASHALAGLVLTLGTATAAQAGGAELYRSEHTVRDAGPNQARIIRPAQEHPRVAVDRTLAAQPVHPWRTEIRLNDIRTHIDPVQRLRKDGRGIDDNHTLSRAQRVDRTLRGITTNELNELRNEARRATQRPALGNRAKYLGPRAGGSEQRFTIIHVIPTPGEAAPQQIPATEPQPRQESTPAQPRPDQIALDD